MTYAHKRFGKFQDKSQIINATTKHQKLSTNKYSNLLGTIPIGPAMLQNQKNKKTKAKKQQQQQQQKTKHKTKRNRNTHNSFTLFIKQSHKIN